MRTMIELGSADLLVGTAAMSLPRTFRAGVPYAVLFSTPGKVRPICQTWAGVTMGNRVQSPCHLTAATGRYFRSLTLAVFENLSSNVMIWFAPLAKPTRAIR